MGMQKNTNLSVGLKLIGLVIFSQGILACGGNGFANKTTFSKNLDAIEMVESDENALGINSEDINCGEEVTMGEMGQEEHDGSEETDVNKEENALLYPQKNQCPENVAENEDSEDAEDKEMAKDEETEENYEAPEIIVENDCPGKGNGKGKCRYTGNPYAEDSPESHPGNRGQGKGPRAKDDGGNYICILEGPGKSIRLGLVEDTPAGQVGTPDVVCMSKMACLDEVSKAFDVKMAHRRGFCANKNPHVVQMSDEEVAVMIEKLGN